MVLCLRKYTVFFLWWSFWITTMASMPFSIMWKLQGTVVGLWQDYPTFSTLKSTSAEMLWLGVSILPNSPRACTCSCLQGATCLCRQDEQEGVNMSLGNFSLGGWGVWNILILPTNQNSVDNKMDSLWTSDTQLWSINWDCTFDLLENCLMVYGWWTY